MSYNAEKISKITGWSSRMAMTPSAHHISMNVTPILENIRVVWDVADAGIMKK